VSWGFFRSTVHAMLRRATAKLIRPVSEAEARLLRALDWLERESLPLSIRQHFVNAIETVLATVASRGVRTLRGCGDAAKYRAVYKAAVERGEFQR
jgi:hypothetical protein